jgi:hypothetical protein
MAETLMSVLEEIRDKLIELIPEQIELAAPDEPVYCLVLAYNGEEPSGLLPPMLGLGLESERQAWLSQGIAKASRTMWNPANFKNYDHEGLWLEDPELSDLCEEADAFVEETGESEPVREMLVEVSQVLAEMVWEGQLTTTPDFVVYAVDFERRDLEANMETSVPPEVLADFRANGWLPD